MDTFVIEPAQRRDAAVILELIREIAEYEKMSDCVEATEEMIAENVPVGFALFFENFSTFKGKSGIYLEDLFVREEKRGKGYGKALFQAVARTAKERGAGRMEWACLDWNEPSIRFYLAMGAQPLSEWTTYRLDEAALAAMDETV